MTNGMMCMVHHVEQKETHLTEPMVEQVNWSTMVTNNCHLNEVNMQHGMK